MTASSTYLLASLLLFHSAVSGFIGLARERRLGRLGMANNTNDRSSSRRWNGNYKHGSKKMSDVTKAKKLKLDLVANGVTKTVEKKRQETLQHVLTKAIIWKLFMNEYPNLEIEHDIGDPDYLPDVVNVDPSKENERQTPLFWGESGRMKVHKAVDLMQRYPDANIVHCRWGMDVETFSRPLLEHLREKHDSGELDLSHRTGKFTFCSLPLDVWRFIDEETGTIHVEKGDLEWKELKFPRCFTDKMKERYQFTRADEDREQVDLHEKDELVY